MKLFLRIVLWISGDGHESDLRTELLLKSCLHGVEGRTDRLARGKEERRQPEPTFHRRGLEGLALLIDPTKLRHVAQRSSQLHRRVRRVHAALLRLPLTSKNKDEDGGKEEGR